MGLDLERFARLRPALVHLTARCNAEAIVEDGVLHPAAWLLRAGGRGAMVRERCTQATVIAVGGRRVVIRDQKPLAQGAIDLTDGWSFGDWVQHLREHVFFWPVRAADLSGYGRRFEGKAVENNQVAMVFDTRELLERNRGGARVSVCNAGALRHHPVSGRARRGPGTLVEPDRFAGTPGTVIEVAFRGRVEIGTALRSIRSA